eukprot:FR736279.1.p4 GENE.FR736279.1~~FR736279.1.p4  ORF type:complete len:104 (+),score=58.02 FR736279.1:946-1257(+)
MCTEPPTAITCIACEKFHQLIKNKKKKNKKKKKKKTRPMNASQGPKPRNPKLKKGPPPEEIQFFFPLIEGNLTLGVNNGYIFSLGENFHPFQITQQKNTKTKK